MYFKDIKKLEEIYPLTIVSRRYGGFAIVNCDNDCDCVSSLQGNEELSYGNYAEIFMDDKWFGVKYGIGKDIESAYKNYVERNG